MPIESYSRDLLTEENKYQRKVLPFCRTVVKKEEEEQRRVYKTLKTSHVAKHRITQKNTSKPFH
jgi:hypothetical protein